MKTEMSEQQYVTLPARFPSSSHLPAIGCTPNCLQYWCLFDIHCTSVPKISALPAWGNSCRLSAHNEVTWATFFPSQTSHCSKGIINHAEQLPLGRTHRAAEWLEWGMEWKRRRPRQKSKERRTSTLWWCSKSSKWECWRRPKWWRQVDDTPKEAVIIALSDNAAAAAATDVTDMCGHRRQQEFCQCLLEIP